VVGGNVNAALWPSSPEDQVDEIFALALECDADIDMHLDNWDGPEAFTLPYVAEQAVRHDMRGRVTVAHVASLGHVAPAIADDTIAALLAAEINVAVLPARIRLTPARALIDAGVNVLVATDIRWRRACSSRS
jgi:cytosine deaminase